jgi:hypothetical protein
MLGEVPLLGFEVAIAICLDALGFSLDELQSAAFQTVPISERPRMDSTKARQGNLLVLHDQLLLHGAMKILSLLELT